MKLEDAVNRAKNKSLQGRERRQHNFYNSPAYPDKLIRLFNSKFAENGFGKPPPTSSKVKGMLNGFIKVCRSSGWSERRVYETLELLVKHWNYVKTYDHHTLNGKKAMVGDRPSLLEFLICRETMLTAIDKAMRQKKEVTTKETKAIRTTERTRFTPTDKEYEEEYNRLMEDM